MARKHGNNGDETAATGLGLRALSALLARSQFAAQHGLSFDTRTLTQNVFDRDIYSALGYDRTLTPAHYRSAFERGDIAQRIIEAYPRATWAGGASLVEDEDPGVVTAFEAAAGDLFERLDAWSRLLRLDILAGLGEYAILLIGVNDGLDLEAPLARIGGPDRVVYLRPVAGDKAAIDKRVEDTADPRFGRPEVYSLQLDGLKSRKVHWSRVLHVAEAAIEDEACGRPRLRAVWNRLQDLQKIVGGGSEAAWRNVLKGMQFDLDPEAELSSSERSSLQDEIDEYIHGMRRTMLTSGMRVTDFGSDVADFGANAETIIGLISATTGIPQRILTGSERGELASSQDRSNWSDRIHERRREFATPVVRDFVNRLVEHGALPKPKRFDVVWPTEDQLSELEKIEAAKAAAEANKAQREAGGTVLLSSDEIRDRFLGLDPLESPGEGADESEADPSDAPVGEEGPSPPASPAGATDASGDTTNEGKTAFLVGDKTVAAPLIQGVVERRIPADSAREHLQILLGLTPDEAERLVGPAEAFAASNPSPSAPEIAAASSRILADFRASDADLADEDAEEPEWVAVHRAADAHREAFAAAVAGAWEDGAAEIDVDAVAEAYAVGTTGLAISRAEEGVEAAEKRMRETLPGRLLEVLNDGAMAALRAARARGSWFRGAALEAEFDRTNERAREWAETRTADLIREIGPDTREAVRQMVAAAFRDGVPPRELARQIRQIVGLRSDQIVAVFNLGTELRNAQPGDLVERFPPQPGLRNRAGFRVRVPKDGPSEAWIQAQVAKYRRMQRNYRARLIARTETLAASNAGQAELWRQNREAGYLPADQQRVWIATPDERTRPEHRERHGVVVGVDEPWPWGSEPGSEPNCRCAHGLATPEDLERAGVVPAPTGPVAVPDPEPEPEPQAEPVPKFANVAQAEQWIRERYARNVDFPGIRLRDIQDVAEALHVAMAGRRAALDHVGWVPRNTRGTRGAAGFFSESKQGVYLQKSFTRTASSTAPKHREIFARNNQRSIAETERYLETLRNKPDLMFFGDKQAEVRRVEDKLSGLRAQVRWAAYTDSERGPVFATIAHEVGHALMWHRGRSFENSWHALVSRTPLAVKASVSEYGASRLTELWAEITAMVADGREAEIPEQLLTAWRAVVAEMEEYG